ncbi:DnaB-like replicative helicase [Gordonia phage Neville]|uniref:DNA 5'-3' helicase n=1 Tax=Gordonia phage Neville TaxID=2301693 RepID=A0A385DY32_9CAUD|nr:DnaB-like replicative helicase [Gordonia phage Neville]AXQ64440.1 DnaB-like dsDNA helicase [Gordonia phage Neville]
MVDVLKQALETTVRSTDERILIAGLTNLGMRDTMPQYLDKLESEDFHFKDHGSIWQAAQKLSADSRTISPENLKMKLRTQTQKNIVDDLAGQSVREIEIQRGIEIVRAASKRRNLIRTLREIAENVSESDEFAPALDFAHSKLRNLDLAEVEDDSSDLLGSLDEFWGDVDASPEEREDIFASQYLSLNDKLNGGFRRKRLYLVGGRPGEGKSLLFTNLASDWARPKDNLKQLYFSAEMSRKEVMVRLMAAGAMADYAALERGDVSAEDRVKLQTYSDEIRNASFAVVDKPSISIRDIRAQATAMKRQGGLDVIYVDYLQIIQPDDKSLRKDIQIGDMSGALKVLARELDVAVFCAVQLNRAQFQQGEKRAPTLTDIRDSDKPSQDCDTAILLHHPKGPPTVGGDVVLYMPKNRTGGISKDTRSWRADQARIA